ncbi:hypothetical protein HPP92_015200 [Vanilla planifolia]|uniref:Piwi domain-containing protein n=1 Tax=Vanilla planifolia TaxID=51239 RepID=A0A835QSZ2_VANPL|nr:hypothetical protein HPP92_015200 [Vanilla planifolia]
MSLLCMWRRRLDLCRRRRVRWFSTPPSTKALVHPSRPGFGTVGKRCIIFGTASYKAVSVVEFVREYLNLDLLFNSCFSGLLEHQRIKLIKENNYSNDRHARSFGVVVDPNPATVEALLKYHEKVCVPSVGQWNMIDKRMVVGGTVDAWACISFSRQQPNAVKNFCNELVAMCINKGMVFKYPPQDICCKPQSQIESSLKEFCSKATQSMNKNQGRLQLLIIILPEASGSYGRIKRICETELGIVSQCCQPRHVPKCNKQYLENVALKINVKVGGCNTVLEDAITKNIPLVTDRPTIIFGADVTHPAPGEDSMASIAAVVASMDWPWITKYKGLVSSQSHRQEIIEDLFKITPDPQRGNVPGGLIRELLIAFYRVTKQKPHRIIFYRDGVSEGQFNQVLLLEMDAIRKAIFLRLLLWWCKKRHHTRLFPQEHNHRDLTDRSGNILPGTVVDRTICHPTEFDFYLCSHAGIQGTSRPTHYHVLFDENKFSADGLQTLTNNLCYTYARCTRAVSVVPPAYYAHLL